MDVLELPRPVINFLRTMSKEMHRYSLCWDIYGGSESVTLTLTWKINCDNNTNSKSDTDDYHLDSPSNINSTPNNTINKKIHQQKLKSIINSDLNTGYSNYDYLNTDQTKTKTNEKKCLLKLNKQFQHSKLDNLTISGNCMGSAPAKTNANRFLNNLNHVRNLSAESQSTNKKIYDDYTDYSDLNKIEHRSRRSMNTNIYNNNNLNESNIHEHTSSNSSCPDCNKTNSDTTSITKKPNPSSLCKKSNNSKIYRGKSLESHEMINNENNYPNKIYSNQQQRQQEQKIKSTIPISIIPKEKTKKSTNESDDYNTLTTSYSNPWVKRDVSESHANNDRDNRVLNIVESLTINTNISTTSTRENYENVYVGNYTNTNTNPSISCNNNTNLKAKDANLDMYKSVGKSLNSSNNNNNNNNHSKVTFDPNLDYI